MSPIPHSALSSLRPYMAVIKDSFREAFASRVLWILLSISTLILLALAPLRIQEQRASQLHPRSIRDWPGLIDRIYQQAQSTEPSPGKQLWIVGGESFQNTLTNSISADGTDQVSRSTVRDLADQLNALLSKPDLYSSEAWIAIELNESVRQQIEDGPDQLTDTDLLYFNRTLLKLAFPEFIARIPDQEISLTYFHWTLLDSLPVTREMAVPAVNLLLANFMSFFVGIVAVFVGILVTAPMIPNTFESGAVDLLMSKPVSRPILFLVKFCGGCVFILLNAGYFVIGLWLVMGTSFGIWSNTLLLCIPLFLFLFSIYYSISACAGVLWKNAIVSIVITILFWGFLTAVGSAKSLLEQFVIDPYRITRLVATEQSLVATNNSGELVEWNRDARTWDPLFDSESGGRRFFASPMIIGPVYNPETNELLYINRPNRGPFRQSNATLIHTTWSGSWQKTQSTAAPRGASWLFLNTDYDLVTLTPNMFYGTGKPEPVTLQASEDSQGFATSSGEILVLGPDGEVTVQSSSSAKTEAVVTEDTGHTFRSLRSQRNEMFTDTFSSAMDFTSGNIVVFDQSTVMLFSKQENANYELSRQRSLPDSDGPAAVALAGDHILVADSKGQVSILDEATLQTQFTFQPSGNGEPYLATSQRDGKWAAVLFHNGTLWLCDMNSHQHRVLSYNATAVAFEGKERIRVAEQGAVINTYAVDSQQLVETYRPRWTTTAFVYYYLVKPMYTLLPKPGELGDVVSYLLTQQETRTDGPPFMGQPADLREERETIDIYGPLNSSLLFVMVILGLTCLQLHRVDL